MTKQQEQFLRNYNYADNGGELWQVYGRFSTAKANAMNYCKKLQADKGGYDGRICSHNSFIFTYAFKFVENGIEKLAYITPTNDYFFTIA